MSGGTEPVDYRALLKRAILSVEELQARVDVLENARREPIAIVGLGCRFPGGANDGESYWRLLGEGFDAVREVPAGRWDRESYFDPDPDAPGKMYGRHGAFLEDVDRFDAAFFGISPREAKRMDPQQRLLLEVAWEALEHAGETAERLAGSATGVFMGICSHDYFWLQFADPAAIDAYSGTGVVHSIAAGRLSYLLDLQGPSVAVDTACSSSLVAVHLACQALRGGECRLALAGGVSLILAPLWPITMSRMRMTAADGRCKTFDRDASGFVQGEGCGIVVLKRLSDAQADGDRILALIRGSAVNQDGRSAGLTAPNPRAQEAVIRQALDNAGVAPAHVTYVEAHGTGTPLGDPIEIEALTGAIGQPRPQGPACALGSVKTNIGHLEAAAGIAGLIKVVLSLQHGAIPPHLHLRELNPNITLHNTPFIIPTTLLPWPEGVERRYAGVSSFGFSGTNAHVILEEAPPPIGAPLRRPPVERLAPVQIAPAVGAGEDRAYLLPLSARSPEALRALAGAYHAFLTAPRQTAEPHAAHDSAISVKHLCYSAGIHRTHHDHCLAVVGSTAGELAARLAAFAQGETSEGAASGHRVAGSRRKLVFVFPGQGSQWAGMGRQLLQQEPVFRATMEQCDAALRREVDWSLLEEVTAESTRSRLDQVDVVQPVLWALQVSLTALWRSWGITPTAVVGHSMGEVAAACVAGALSLEDAARVICRRSLLLRRLRGRGAMAAVGLSFQEAQAVLCGYEDRLSIAASNGARSSVLSGDPAALEEVMATLRSLNIFCRLVKVDVAAHSPQVDELRADLFVALAGLRPRPASLLMYSTVIGRRADDLPLDAGYWARNLRQPVLFAETIQRLLDDGHGTFLEISASPILLPAIQQGRQDAGLDQSKQVMTLLPSLQRDADERGTMVTSLASLYALGYSVTWQGLFPAGGSFVRLPSYPWQHERFWLDLPGRRPEEGPPAVPPPVQERVVGWLYDVQWQPQDLPTGEGAAPLARHRGRTWLIFADTGGVGQALTAVLRQRGERCALVWAGASYDRIGDDQWSINPGDPHSVERLVHEVREASAPTPLM
ncbi:MAG TPA: type I polyketide synthase, partial [Chloroflexota bacterium]|nr:type I polyketide synthase [Chloroflexota bacterium]